MMTDDELGLTRRLVTPRKLAEQIAPHLPKLSKRMVSLLLSVLFEVIKKNIAEGERVVIPKFGLFEVRVSKRGRIRTYIRFKPAPSLRQCVGIRKADKYKRAERKRKEQEDGQKHCKETHQTTRRKECRR